MARLVDAAQRVAGAKGESSITALLLKWCAAVRDHGTSDAAQAADLDRANTLTSEDGMAVPLEDVAEGDEGDEDGSDDDSSGSSDGEQQHDATAIMLNATGLGFTSFRIGGGAEDSLERLLTAVPVAEHWTAALTLETWDAQRLRRAVQRELGMKQTASGQQVRGQDGWVCTWVGVLSHSLTSPTLFVQALVGSQYDIYGHTFGTDYR